MSGSSWSRGVASTAVRRGFRGRGSRVYRQSHALAQPGQEEPEPFNEYSLKGADSQYPQRRDTRPTHCESYLLIEETPYLNLQFYACLW